MGWRSWEEVKTVSGNHKWRDSVKALCATTGSKRIGVGEIYRIELDSNVSEIARKEMQEAVEGTGLNGHVKIY